jgi:hypothetical protein
MIGSMLDWLERHYWPSNSNALDPVRSACGIETNEALLKKLQVRAMLKDLQDVKEEHVVLFNEAAVKAVPRITGYGYAEVQSSGAAPVEDEALLGTDETTSDEEEVGLAPLAIRADVRVEILKPESVLGQVARSIMLDRLCDGDGTGYIPPADLAETSDICFGAYVRLGGCHGLCFAKVLGALDASILCEGLVVFVDGVGSCGGGGGAALEKRAEDFARLIGAKVLMLKARDGSQAFWQRAGYKPIPAAWRAKRRSGTGSPCARAAAKLQQEMAPIPDHVTKLEVGQIIDQLLKAANVAGPPFLKWL